MEIAETAGAQRGVILRYYPKRSYSFYEEVIARLRFQLKYFNRHLKKVQGEFHIAEGRLHRALMGKDPSGKIQRAPEDVLDALRREADKQMELFCNAYQYQQALVVTLQDAVHADAEGKKSLHGLSNVTYVN